MNALNYQAKPATQVNFPVMPLLSQGASCAVSQQPSAPAPVCVTGATDEQLEASWNDADDVLAGQELMLRLQRRIAASMRYWLYRRPGERAADYRSRREEAVSEVLVRVIGRLRERGYDRGRGVKLMTYSLNLAHGYLLHWLTTENRWERMEDIHRDTQSEMSGNSSEECPPALRAGGPDPSELAEIAMAVDEMAQHLKSLPAKERIAFGYTALVGMSVREAAEVIGCHPSQVSRHSRAAVTTLVKRLPPERRPDEPSSAAMEYPEQFADALWSLERAV